MKNKALIAASALSIMVVYGLPVAAHAATSKAKKKCEAIKRTDFSGIPEAPTEIIRASVVDEEGEKPAYCAVEGVIAPSVGISFKLPLSGWNSRFFQAGCGNWCGAEPFPSNACDEPLRRGYACITTDAGHVARPGDVHRTDGQWAYDNLQAELDYGGRASHVTAVAGKAIAEKFYGNKPEYSYYMGCSYGGHQAMVLAQRFPWDFDGIVGGGAPNNLATLMQQNLWALKTAYDEEIMPVFSEADIDVLHSAALEKCDADDGVTDGLISNPAACVVDPAALVCKGGNRKDCLSKKTALAAAKMYSGPTDSSGRKISAGGWAPGSELFWRRVYRADGTGLAALAKNYFRYMARYPDLGPGWDPSSYDFNEDYRRNDVMDALYAADNPDLRRFRDAGGKFINYVGWYDLGTLPAEAIDYYETAVRTNGGYDQTAEFFRMFMIPGALHCRGGEGPEKIDFLSYIEAWVEQGEAPESMIGERRNAEGETLFTRPVFAYPNYAKYKGEGDSRQAENFISSASE